MNTETLRKIREHIKANENVKNFPYVVNGGIMTGAGFNVDSRNAFLDFPFVIERGGKMVAATAEEKSQGIR